MYRETVNVTAGSTAILYLGVEGLRLVGLPITIKARPGGGGSALVETTGEDEDAVEGATATWEAWDEGTVTTAKGATLNSLPTAVRFTATTQDAEFDIIAPKPAR